jgi:circadian clock protein KaiB
MRSAPKKTSARPSRQCVFRLFVAGASARSQQIILSVRQLCDDKLKNSYTLEVIDIYQQPALLREYQIIATPTLIKDAPLPISRYLGSLAIITGISTELDLIKQNATTI